MIIPRLSHGTVVLFLLLAVAPAVAEETSPLFSSTVTMFNTNVKPSLSIRMGDAPDAYVIIHPDGSIEYGKDYAPDAAAKVLWDAVGIERKARNCS